MSTRATGQRRAAAGEVPQDSAHSPALARATASPGWRGPLPWQASPRHSPVSSVFWRSAARWNRGWWGPAGKSALLGSWF